MSTRRSFLKTAALTPMTCVPFCAANTDISASTHHFGLHPFIERHPEAVFIMQTSLQEMHDAEPKTSEGRRFGASVFLPMGTDGIPQNISIPIKPNFKTSPYFNHPQEELQGTATDPWFVGGMLESMKDIGINPANIHLREGKRPSTFTPYGFVSMAERVGADLRVDLGSRVGDTLTEGRDFNWTDIPNGVVFEKLPHLEPINTPGTILLNISKFKSHPMGMTLCCKNLQGSVAQPYQQFCNPSPYRGERLNCQKKDAWKNVRKNYERHVREGRIPRWDRPDRGGGLWQELWASRTLDNVSATPCALSVIEGLYGRDGNASICGPHPMNREHSYNWLGFSKTGRSKDYLTNIVVFGCDIFRVDIIGHWLAAHEPGNFGLFHLALERGLSSALDPEKIPVYLWDNGSAVRQKLDTFRRSPLLTMYLRKDYNGMNETFYHLVNEPYDYSQIDGIDTTPLPVSPNIDLLYHYITDDTNNGTAIFEYRLPLPSRVSIIISNERNDIIARPLESTVAIEAGSHALMLCTRDIPPGNYTVTLKADIPGVRKTKGFAL